MPEYLLILLLLLTVTIFIHKRNNLKLFKSSKHMFIIYLIPIVVGIAWDQFAIYRGHWTFGKEFLLGIYIGYMPIEEFLFMIVCLYFGLTFYKLIENLIRK
ncbi:hypothetical protein A2690_03815 [Candidatus Roizmanbacteria bacterium RIFCSPHIGHO2_01_FULL_39_12b]|uniref:Lycopene cyclase domain-containing protein n=1 Tax=Candidatus Roizmanbacteria bacterium RIFCSPHIGHO2_01_FULL_39_12b TaxID=1802030 RepID=A0A1F7GC61_9BACT|nr:MAG: hypothetical protein A2690_03815 [Candidatus Roizmanbacteria bacterium RIFCSPHIGHO2_01_FULL_39_12b]OGK47068.1 MAG: hypothetical protein A3B46_01540 [Candidatus Roizmanbacteria bacterium RIFCSPLOWO2_01_FULL_39_19]